MLKSIIYFAEAVPFFKINKGIRWYNIINLLVLFRALINAGEYLEVIF